jgi:hypothetical protein
MSQKQMYYIAVFVGSIVGGYIPILWGEGFFSISSLLFGTAGSIIGMILVYKYL